MRSKLFQVALLIFALTGMVPSILVAAENPGAGGQGSGSDDQKYVGEWAGSYSTDDGYTNKLSYTLSKEWRSRSRFQIAAGRGWEDERKGRDYGWPDGKRD